VTTTSRTPATDLASQPAVSLLDRLARSRSGEATWVTPAHLGVVALAAVLYVVNLTVSGFANTYYSAAAQAASQSWSAWFFGSIDAASFITVDKPPLATMVMGLSVRLLGLSSWSILLPEALMGAAAVAILFALVRRTFGPLAAVIAGLVMALTPVAVLIFRYNNPDALLTLLLVLAAWAFVRALETGRLRWVLAAAVIVGFAFNTKYLQAYLVLPAFALVYAAAGAGSVRRRVAGLAVGLTGVIVSSGWWVAVMALLPPDARPFIGGSTANSALDLVFGYDGLGRIFGGGGGGGGGPPGGGGGFSGTPGLLRLFNAELGGQIAWFLPLAFVGLAVGLWARRRAPRTDLARAAYLTWGLWLVTHAVVFSSMSGTIHSYYTVAMAPAIAALVGGGLVELWYLRQRTRWGGLALGAALVGSAVVAWQLLERTPDFAPGLGIAIVVVAALVAIIVAVPATLDRSRTAVLAAGLGLAMLLAGPGAYALATIGTAISGGDPSAGPSVSTGGPGGDGGFGGRGDGDVLRGDGDGMIGATSATLVDYLVANRGHATWIVAVTSAFQAGSIQLEAGLPVMAMGGFTGSDPAPTLAQLQGYIASGQLRFVIAGGGMGGAWGRPTGGSSGVTAWVTTACTAVDLGTAGGSGLYDCAAAVGSGS